MYRRWSSGRCLFAAAVLSLWFLVCRSLIYLFSIRFHVLLVVNPCILPDTSSLASSAAVAAVGCNAAAILLVGCSGLVEN